MQGSIERPVRPSKPPEAHDREGLWASFLSTCRTFSHLPVTAVLELKSRLLEMGASPYSMRAKLTGGATMFGKHTETIGKRNCEAAMYHLERHGIQVLAKHLGGDKGRVIRFSLKDWSIEVKMARESVAVI